MRLQVSALGHGRGPKYLEAFITITGRREETRCQRKASCELGNMNGKPASKRRGGAGHPEGYLTKSAARFSRLRIWKPQTKAMAGESPTSSFGKPFTEPSLIHGNHPTVVS